MIQYIIKPEKKILFQMFCIVLTFVFLFLNPLVPGDGTAYAQGNEDGKMADFLFQKPKTSFGFRAGMFFPKADSGIFNMVKDELTIEKSDFRTWDFGVDLGFSLRERFELVFSLDHSKSSEDSEFRYYVDESGRPITQTTDFSQTPLTVGIKYLFIPRGRQIGQYSWMPNRIVPYVMAGAGILWYEFSQYGDFVDYSTMEIFPANLESSGSTITGYLGCGTEINIFKSAYLNLDFRYYLADDDMGGDFVGFDPIELGGFRFTTGINWYF